MPYSNSCRNAVGNLPNEFLFNLISILDPVLGPDYRVTVFMDDEADPTSLISIRKKSPMLFTG